MQHQDARDQEIQTLRERLSRLGQASLRINESLDFDKVLQVSAGAEVVDSARDDQRRGREDVELPDGLAATASSPCTTRTESPGSSSPRA